MSVCKKAKRQMDMLHGPMLKNILLFALPLAASGIIQQLFTSADMAVIYFFDGTDAQAAVSSNGALVNLLINLFAGISVGVTVVIAELIGKRLTDDVHSVVFTAVIVASVSGLLLLGVGIGVAQPILKVMDVPPDVLPLAVKYLRIYFIGMPFLMVYDFGAAMLRSLGDTVRPLIVLFASGVLNVALNLLFVGAFGMGVAGVATATVFANVMCAVMVLIFIMKNDMLRIRFGRSKFDLKYLKRMCAIGLPAGVQGAVFSLANVFIQKGINGFGEAAMAGSGDAVNFEMYVYYFVSGFANATVAFFGQNYAAGEYGRCRNIFLLTMLSALIVSTVLSVSFTLGGRLFIRIYTDDPAAIEFAVMRMWCVLIGSMLPCLYEIAGGALRGLGHSLMPAVFTVIGSCVLRLVWIYTVFAVRKEFWVLVIVYPVSWIITGAAMLVAYYVVSKKAFKQAVPAADAACKDGADGFTAQTEIADCRDGAVEERAERSA